MTTCNNTLCPCKNDCARHESHFSYETTPKHHDFNHHSGSFACDDFLCKQIIYSYKCKKCGSTYTGLKEPLSYSNCVVIQPSTGKCNGNLIEL